MKLLLAREMATMDLQAVKQYGVPSLTLMENAGRSVAEVASQYGGGVRGKKIVLYCGKGNNGGDGLVAARHLARLGAEPKVFLVGSFQDLKDDGRVNLDMAKREGIDVTALSNKESLADTREEASRSALLIDALFGTGFTPPARGLYADAIALINSLDVPVISVDLPSGLSADNGRISGASVTAASTVTFGLPKVGQFLYPATGRYGRLYLVDIGFPKVLEEKIPSSHTLVTKAMVSSIVKPRSPEDHKGNAGHILILAGSRGLVGAAILAARGALRAGAGLVTVALPRSVAAPSLPSLPEAMIIPLPETENGTPGLEALDVILEHLPGKRAVAIGPGLSRNPETALLVRSLVPKVPVPLVIDADGLAAYGSSLSGLLESSSEIVVTPHPGELGFLLGLSGLEIQQDRIKFALDFSKKYGVKTVLKGARTVITTPSGEVFLNVTGNAGMAAGGMGDVLTGVVAALIGQGYPPCDAALAGVYLHGKAGDLAAAERGSRGFLAGEVADMIPRSIDLSESSPEENGDGCVRVQNLFS